MRAGGRPCKEEPNAHLMAGENPSAGRIGGSRIAGGGVDRSRLARRRGARAAGPGGPSATHRRRRSRGTDGKEDAHLAARGRNGTRPEQYLPWLLADHPGRQRSSLQPGRRVRLRLGRGKGQVPARRGSSAKQSHQAVAAVHRAGTVELGTNKRDRRAAELCAADHLPEGHPDRSDPPGVAVKRTGKP